MENKNHKAIFTMVLVAMFAAVGAITSWISIPMPSGVPVTLQTFGMALIGFTLGYKYGTLSVAVYVALGAVGVPVFSGFMGGIGKIVGPTGGFIWGFIFMAFLCGLARLKVLEKRRPLVRAAAAILLGLAGLAVCHLLGVAQYTFVNSKGLGFGAAALLVSVPYLLKDIISVIAAYFASLAATKLMKKATHNN